jgi:hypothetical protein
VARGEVAGSAQERTRILGALARLFPQARAIELQGLQPNTACFMALLRLPTRIGEASVAIHRQGVDDVPPTGGRLVGLPHRIGSGHGEWGWLIEFDDQVSEAEIIQLVIKQLLRDPQLGDPEEDERQRLGR